MNVCETNANILSDLSSKFCLFSANMICKYNGRFCWLIDCGFSCLDLFHLTSDSPLYICILLTF